MQAWSKEPCTHGVDGFRRGIGDIKVTGTISNRGSDRRMSQKESKDCDGKLGPEPLPAFVVNALDAFFLVAKVKDRLDNIDGVIIDRPLTAKTRQASRRLLRAESFEQIDDGLRQGWAGTVGVIRIKKSMITAAGAVVRHELFYGVERNVAVIIRLIVKRSPNDTKFGIKIGEGR